MATIKVDMHFHPSMGSSPSGGRCLQILQKCQAFQLNALVVTDHPYKYPRQQFQALYNTQQQLLKQDKLEWGWLKFFHLYPGIEVMTLEQVELIIFDYRVRGNGSAKLYRIHEADTLINSCYRHTIEDAILIAKSYGFPVFAPHPYLPGGYNPTKILGKTPEGREKLAAIIEKYHIGVEMHNNGWGAIQDVLHHLGLADKLPLFAGLNDRLEMVRSTPLDFIADAKAAFVGGGSDSHTPGTMGSGLQFPHNGPLTREAVFATICTSHKAAIALPDRGLLGSFKAAAALFGSLGLVVKECLTDENIRKEVMRERDLILEAYVQAHEHPEIDINKIIQFKAVFPGDNIMNHLTAEQRARLKRSWVMRILAQIAQGRHLNVDSTVTKELLLEAYARAWELRVPGVEQIEQVFGGKEQLAKQLSADQRNRIEGAQSRA